jgi:hypothetical protein
MNGRTRIIFWLDLAREFLRQEAGTGNLWRKRQEREEGPYVPEVFFAIEPPESCG